MDDLQRFSLLTEAHAVFCRGMAVGYASGAKATSVPGKPGWKYYEYTEGPWYLRDEYYMDPDTGKSVGHVTLERRTEDGKFLLVWFTAYGGFYKQEAIPCLKDALLSNYRRGIFNASRGPSRHIKGGYCYDIYPQGSCSFERFVAHESIGHSVKQSGGGGVFAHDGGHDIWGMALI